MENDDYIEINGRRLKKIGERTGDKMSDRFKPKVQGSNFYRLNKPTKKRIANHLKEELKYNATYSEKYFRTQLFKHKIPHDFQHEILSAGQFIIADFFIKRLNLIIEVDGVYHLTQKQKSRDYFKDLHYEELNYNVIRIKNEDVENFPFEWLKKSYDTYTMQDAIFDMASIHRKYSPLKKKKKKHNTKNKSKQQHQRKKCCGSKLERRPTKGNNRKPNQEYGYKYILVCNKCGKTYLDFSSIFYF